MINNRRQVFTLRTLQLNRKHRLKKKIKKKISLESDNISSIEPLYKFLDPYYCHRFLSDLMIIDKLYQNDNFYISIYEKLAITKHILSVDRTEHYLFVNFLERGLKQFFLIFFSLTNFFFLDIIDKSPLGFISERLKSLGSLEAFRLAKTLELYAERIDLIIQTRIFGQTIEFLNNLNVESLEYIREYFKMIEKAEIPNNNWKLFFDERIKKNSKNLCFFLKFNKLKPGKGIELLAMGMNWELHKLVTIL